MQTPLSGLEAKVRPRSASERCAGPSTFHDRYGPVSSTDFTLVSGVLTTHGPNRASSVPSVMSTWAELGLAPKGRLALAKRGCQANGKRRLESVDIGTVSMTAPSGTAPTAVLGHRGNWRHV